MTTAEQTMLDREFLNIRSRLLDIASSLDRVDRCDETTPKIDPTVEKIREALFVLQDSTPDRAERIQMIFSDAYQESWLNQ